MLGLFISIIVVHLYVKLFNLIVVTCDVNKTKNYTSLLLTLYLMILP
uniref:Uncharacterized protein n=1 Tax=Platysiphonia delicata TaxID=2006979 RepID=A0A1Z1M114_9FLOR|nr:hypothetical protein [Platysiphonia delicata]ARW59561.1 hypothetical protein [Platysiphonia delicata]